MNDAILEATTGDSLAPPAARRLRSERGQTTLFFIAAFWTLFLFLAFIVNLGQAINRRVILQMIADSGAWSGATRQAQVLNSLYKLNWAEKWFVFTPTQLLTVDFTVTLDYLADIADPLWQIGNEIFKLAFAALNVSGNIQAVVDAQDVTDKNAGQLLNGMSLTYPPIGIPIIGDPRYNGIITVKGVSKGEGENTYYTGIYWIGVTEHHLDLSEAWYVKDSDMKNFINFFWWVSSPQTDGVVLPSVFKIPAMTAVALAKPTNGSIDPDNSDYGGKFITRMLPVSYLNDSNYSNYDQTMAFKLLLDAQLLKQASDNGISLGSLQTIETELSNIKH
jgi:putative Flp pilus-assembly TadE/G-like protein